MGKKVPYDITLTLDMKPSTRPYTLYAQQKDRFFCLSRLTSDSMQIAVLLNCGSADRVAFYSLV